VNPSRFALLLVAACSSEPTNDPGVVHTDPVGSESLVESDPPPDSERNETDTEQPVESTLPPDSERNETDTELPIESEFTPDSDPTDTEQPIESDPPTESDSPSLDTEPPSESEPPLESTPDSEPLTHSYPIADTDTAAGAPSDTIAVVDSDPSMESDPSADSEPPGDTDPPRDSDPTAHSDTSAASTDSEPESDPPHTDDPPSQTDSPADPRDTDTDSPPADSDENPAADWPIAPQCTFRTDGVYAPRSEWRSIDFDNQAGDYLLLGNMFVPLGGAGANSMVMTLGNSTNRLWSGFFDAPGSGISAYQTVLSASIQAPGLQNSATARPRGPADYDADGLVDVLYYASAPVNECMALTDLAGARTADTWEWRFRDSDAAGTPAWCQPEDINGDGHTDVHFVYRLPNGASETRWYLGPFPRGDLDLAGTVALRLPLPDYRSGFHAPGDYNGDGQVDLALAWWGADLTDGEILIWFGPLSGDLDPNLPDNRIESTSGSGYFANHLVINAGDIDGDGTDDLAFKSTEHRNGFPFSNAVYVFKGPLHPGPGLLDDDADSIITWPATMARTGNFLIPLGDVDGDERDDFAVNVWAGRHRPPTGFPLRPIWPPELVPPEGSDTALPPDTDAGGTDIDSEAPPPPDSPTPDDSSWDTGPSSPPPPFNPFPWGVAQGAIMVFGDTPPGEIGPQQAKFTLAGTRPGDWIGRVGMIGPGDLNGDGLADLAYSADPYGTGVRVRVVFPCADFGEPVAP
jgi:hypothetical protein